MRRFVGPALVVATLGGVLFVGVFPTRTFMDQRSAIAEAQAELDDVTSVNARLEERIAALETDAEIERIARKEYNLVYPGQESYAILPPPEAPVVLPSAWPFSALADDLGR